MENINLLEMTELTGEELMNIDGGSIAHVAAYCVGAYVANSIDFWAGTWDALCA
jgi:lactobin A/cerein 7B family class IIb bacteriocin